MTLPTISQYSESISQPKDMFRSLQVMNCERDAYGVPVFTSGGSGAVFKVYIDGSPMALKCFSGCFRGGLKPLYDYLSEYGSPLLYRTEWLPDEIYVFDNSGNGNWYDVVLSEWAEGSTLEYEIRKALHYHDGTRLLQLAESFEAMACKLFEMPWAHGDLKPSNIMVEQDGTMRLLDYESMIVPGIENRSAAKSAYGHPNTNAKRDGKHIDEYPTAMIACTLRSLARDPALYDKYGTSDYFLFSPDELFAGDCKAYDEAVLSAARCGDARLHTMLKMLASQTPQLDCLPEILTFSSEHISSDCCPEPFVKGGKWGYRSGSDTVIPAMYENALEFREDTGVVEIGKFRHFIDRSGQVIINGSEYETVKSFSNGCAQVRLNGKWCRIDHSGKLIPENNKQ